VDATSAALSAWIGREEQQDDEIGAAPQRALWATLDRDGAAPGVGEPAIALSHWLYFHTPARERDVGADGHARRGEFLPPVPLPRRMWAGGRVEFHAPLIVGERAVRRSRIDDVRMKQGRTGMLVFVAVRHEVASARGPVLTEVHDIVYREAVRAAEAPSGPRDAASASAVRGVADAAPAPTDETFRRAVMPDAVLLFRYSALTFNGHRIHYDRPYATEVEGYPGLVVHGPLIATLLLDLSHRHRPHARPVRFDYRARSPLFDARAFDVCGVEDGAAAFRLWARGDDGRLAMEARVATAAGAGACA
jgi:3-methylfumaryl-CoA hydratase